MHTSLLSILHISDFHFTKRKSRDQQVVVDALIDDLEQLCIGHRRPDLVIFSGDLVNWGGVDSHAGAYDFLLARVAEATGCSDERMFIAPGNHDLSQAAVTASKAEHQEWRAAAGDANAMNSLFDGNAFEEIAQKKFEAYFELERYLSDGSLRHRNQFASVYWIAALNIDIVVLNTAMLSVGGHKEFPPDEGLLAVPEYALLDAARALTQGSYRVYVTHHPFNMLSESAARILRRSIEENAHVHLYGHMHDPESRNSVGFRGQLFSDQAGAVFTQRTQAYIGYSLISVDRTTGYYETHLRTYFDDRKAFDEARDVVTNGKFYSSQEASQFWRKVATPIDDSAFRKHLAGTALDAFTAEMKENESDWEAHELFVPPPMKRTPNQSVAGDGLKSSDSTHVPFDNIIRDEGNIVIYAAAEYGRTTVLRELAYRMMAEASDLRFPRLPILVDFNDVKQNITSLLRVVRSRAPELYQSVDTESVLKLGHACLLIDDVVFEDLRRMQILRDFIKAYPKVRYVLSALTGSAAPYGSHVNLEMPIHFDFVELCVFRRRDMRQLVAKFNGGTDVDAVLDRLQAEFQEINIPFTAANGSILMSIYEEQSGFRPINRSVLIEQFIDTTLKKAAIEQSRRETFDYANKTALLADLAGWMAQQNNYTPASEDVRSVMKFYINRVGLNVPLDDLLQEFLNARIFVRKNEDRLRFRYRAILEYFIALQMSISRKFKEWVLAEERYLQFVNEIQYYAGKLRNDDAMVDEIGRRFEAVLLEFQGEGRPLDPRQIQSLRLPGKDGELADDLLNQYLEEPLTEEERDAELEAQLPQDVEKRQEVFRPEIKDSGQKLLVSLFLYSGVLKNMELIDDPQKRQHLAALWRGWSIFWLISLMVIPEIARHRRFRINGVLYELNAPHDMPDAELARALSLGMPNGIGQMMAASLGTEKLERQLVEPLLSTSNEPLAYEFLRTSLIADLKLSATPGTIKAALERFRVSPYLAEALVWKVAALRRMDRINSRHFDAILPQIAATLADLSGVPKKERDEEKRRQMLRLNREKLMLRIKHTREGD